ncbi:hypothetical protein MHYP_G00146650 [Metynnis hypsauchen]
MNSPTLHDVPHGFQTRFFSMCRLQAFQWESLEAELKASESPSEIILDILKKTCLHSICRKNPPSVKYRRLFLSELIKRYELTAAEPLDELYEALAEVIGAEEKPVCYKTYLLPSGEPVSLEENVAVISEGTTGLVTWEAALYLSEWALENPHIFTGRTVLELGSGAGLTGIVVCQACKPTKYVFSDVHQGVLQRLRNNIQHNGLTEQDVSAASACVEELDWENVREEQLRRIGADTVIAADVVYDPDVIGCLVKLLVKLLNCKTEEKPPDVYVASTIRNPRTYDSFKDELGKAGLKHTVVTHPVTQVFPYARVSSIEMIKIHC